MNERSDLTQYSSNAPLCKGGCRLRLGDCNLHEQFCLRGGLRTADHNPSAPPGRLPLHRGGFFAAEGREYTSPTAPLKGSQDGKDCFVFLLFAIGRLCATAAIYGGPTAFIEYRSITKHLLLRGWQFRAVPAGHPSKNATRIVFAWPRRADHITPVKCP